MSTQKGLDTSTPYGKFDVQVTGVIAEFERGRIGERVRDSRRYLIGGGSWPGGRTIYGYRWLPNERRWVVVPEKAEWRYSTIRKMLVHPGYKGRHQIGIPMPPIIDESTRQQTQ